MRVSRNSLAEDCSVGVSALGPPLYKAVCYVVKTSYVAVRKRQLLGILVVPPLWLPITTADRWMKRILQMSVIEAMSGRRCGVLNLSCPL